MSPAEPRKVVVVADDRDLVSFLEAAVEHLGHELIASCVAADLPSVLRERDADVLVIDADCRVDSRKDLLVRVRDFAAACAIVALHAGGEERARALRAGGASTAVRKPFELSTLGRALATRRAATPRC